jgi:hypothetical protein
LSQNLRSAFRNPSEVQERKEMTEMNQGVLRAVLKAAIKRSVVLRLGGLTREFSEVVVGMSPEDKKTAGLLILDMVGEATNEFIATMKTRIETRGYGGGH